jgi:hypothetical protein
VALGAPIADPIIGLAITLVILRITWDRGASCRGPTPAKCRDEDSHAD